jgi:nitrite reductase/ring-hydroxylating ferredoxin subunit
MSKIVAVTPVGNLKEFRPLLFQHDGIPYTVLLKNGRINSFINICPHQDKVFKPQLKSNCLICPFHDVAFDAESGDVIDGNGKTVRGTLPKAQVFVREGWVYLEVDEHHRVLMKQAMTTTQARARKRKWRWIKFFGLGR